MPEDGDFEVLLKAVPAHQPFIVAPQAVLRRLKRLRRWVAIEAIARVARMPEGDGDMH
jgi:hypothetical protein